MHNSYLPFFLKWMLVNGSQDCSLLKHIDYGQVFFSTLVTLLSFQQIHDQDILRIYLSQELPETIKEREGGQETINALFQDYPVRQNVREDYEKRLERGEYKSSTRNS